MEISLARENLGKILILNRKSKVICKIFWPKKKKKRFKSLDLILKYILSQDFSRMYFKLVIHFEENLLCKKKFVLNCDCKEIFIKANKVGSFFSKVLEVS